MNSEIVQKSKTDFYVLLTISVLFVVLLFQLFISRTLTPIEFQEDQRVVLNTSEEIPFVLSEEDKRKLIEIEKPRVDSYLILDGLDYHISMTFDESRILQQIVANKILKDHQSLKLVLIENSDSPDKFYLNTKAPETFFKEFLEAIHLSNLEKGV